MKIAAHILLTHMIILCVMRYGICIDMHSNVFQLCQQWLSGMQIFQVLKTLQNEIFKAKIIQDNLFGHHQKTKIWTISNYRTDHCVNFNNGFVGLWWDPRGVEDALDNPNPQDPSHPDRYVEPHPAAVTFICGHGRIDAQERCPYTRKPIF